MQKRRQSAPRAAEDGTEGGGGGGTGGRRPLERTATALETMRAVLAEATGTPVSPMAPVGQVSQKEGRGGGGVTVPEYVGNFLDAPF